MGVQRHDRGHLVFVTLLAAAITATSSCEIIPHTTEFIVRVDEIEIAESATTGDPVAVRFLGTVGSNSCSRLVHVEKRLTIDSLTIRFHGERRHGTSCKTAPTVLEHEETLPSSLGHPFTIGARQPSGPELVRVVSNQ